MLPGVFKGKYGSKLEKRRCSTAVKRFKSAAIAIGQARDERAVERAMRHFLASLTSDERAAVEALLGYALPVESTRFASTADDLTRCQRLFGSRNADRAVVAETAQIYIIASNRLYQFGA